MTDAERELLLYVAGQMAWHPEPAVIDRPKMVALIQRIVAEGKPLSDREHATMLRALDAHFARRRKPSVRTLLQRLWRACRSQIGLSVSIELESTSKP